MEKTSDDKKKLKSFVSALQKSVECPICLETVKQPFKVCVRGHSVCLECIKKLEKCPLCQELFTLENLVCLKNVLEALPRFCCYSDAGCEEVVEPGDDHEMFCGFRPIVCREEECSVKMPLVKILDHYKSNHSDTYIFTKKIAPVNMDLLSFDLPLYTLVSLFNNIFWIYEVKDDTENLWKIFFQATPIGKLEHDYYVRIEFKKEEMVYIHTLKAAVMSSCKTKLEGEGEQGEQPKEEYCMKIPVKELHNFLNDKGSHVYSFNFFEKKTANV